MRRYGSGCGIRRDLEPFIDHLPNASAATGWRQLLATALEPYRADPATAPVFRARQLQAMLRLTPVTMATNALNVVIIVCTFWGTGAHEWLLAWSAAVFCAVGVGARGWLRWRARAGVWQHASRRALHRATVHAAALALLWGLLPIILLDGADSGRQTIVATICIGMICAGGFALTTIPTAATAWVVLMTLGTTIGAARSNFPLALPFMLLLAVYGVIVIASVWATARLFGARMSAEAKAERQNEVIGLLLRDFEENASDLLWEVDAAGRLCRISSRLEVLLARPAAELASRPVLHWIRKLLPDEPETAAQLAQLEMQLATGQPFRDVPLTLVLDGTPRWWHLSAKALHDAEGQRIGWRGVAADITEAHHANRQLSWLAHFDALTGIANRHQLRSRLAQLLLEGVSGEMPRFAVLCVDLDHFKNINDTLGHATGDALLREVAQRLRGQTRGSDVVARLGGDEFAVLLHPVESVAAVEATATRLLADLAAPCEVQGARIVVRGSIGVVIAPDHGTDIDTLLGHGDLALYAAKSAGRGEYRMFEPAMAASTRRRLAVEQALIEALARGEFSLAFQPKVDLVRWQVTGFEALLRWNHPTLGAVSPAEFVPVAEESGQITAIGVWVLTEACRQAASWPEDVTVSVNVSAVQAMSNDLLRSVQDALGASGLAATRLELEITESIFLHDAQTTLAQLHELRATGIRIALDDFGTGYSSLAYLRRFPFDTLKIDRAFVRELMQRPDARAIVKMILGLARTLKMETVAEGVEEPAQAGLLAHHGCTTMQGYLVSPPMPTSEVAGWLSRWQDEPLLPQPPMLDTAPLEILA